MKNISLLLFFISLSVFTYAQSLTRVVHYVQPLIGTGRSTTPAALKHSEGTELQANTIPAVAVPFGMTQWSPQTGITEKKCVAPYYYGDPLFYGFRGSHWISGSCMPDYGSFTIMPLTGKLKTNLREVAVPLNHSAEISSPYYYSIGLADYGIQSEITATERCALLRFTVNKSDSLHILIRPNSDKGKGFIKIDRSKNEISGYNPAYRIYQNSGKPAGFNGYFVIQVERPFDKGGTNAGSLIYAKDSLRNCDDLGAFISFKVKRGEVLQIRVGTSFTSLDEARKNLKHEIPAWNFEILRNAAEAKWEKALGQIRVEGNSQKDKRIFYTALYHSLQHPRLFSDVSGTYPRFSGSYTIEKLKQGNYYDDFSMWDIYRAQLPLVEILQPDRVNDMVSSLILKGQQGGWLPIFPCWNNYTNAMIGDHSIAFIASAYLKNIRNYDVGEAYRLMRKNAFEIPKESDYKDGKGRRALSSYIQYNYIPLDDGVAGAFHRKEQVSRTLEYAYDDYALALVAKDLKKDADYIKLKDRAKNYAQIFDNNTKLMRGRYANGDWYHPFNPDKKLTFITEGTARQYSFYVPHDIPALASLMGGTKVFETALDSLFMKGEYWHGNEPGHQTPFLYNFTNSPWKSQKVVREIINQEYTEDPGGLSGNDDAGQLSAWYVFAALGIYPADPVSGNYLIVSPIFDRIDIRLPNGKQLRIMVTKKTKSDAYIQSVKYNGRVYSKNYFPFALLNQGGLIEIELTKEPNLKWGKKEIDKVPGFSEFN